MTLQVNGECSYEATAAKGAKFWDLRNTELETDCNHNSFFICADCVLVTSSSLSITVRESAA